MDGTIFITQMIGPGITVLAVPLLVQETAVLPCIVTTMPLAFMVEPFAVMVFVTIETTLLVVGAICTDVHITRFDKYPLDGPN